MPYRQRANSYMEMTEKASLRGRDEFIPFLEQHTELTPEDEKLLDEIMATESDWYRTAEEAEENHRRIPIN